MQDIVSNRETTNQLLATYNSISPVGAENVAARMGRAPGTGETVQVSSNEADINDMKEEVGMMKATLGKVDLSKLKVRKGAGTDLEALARIADFYDKLPNLPTNQKTLDLIKQLETYEESFKEGGKGGGNLPTADDIRNLLREFDGDVSHQFAALEDVRLRFEAKGAPPSFLALLDEVRKELRQPETAQEIKAGFASAREAKDLADRFNSAPEDFRDSYRQMLRSGGNLGRIFDSLGDFATSGVKGEKTVFETVINSFIQVAGDDMKSFGPSADKVILGDVIAELTVLKNLRTTMGMTVDMLDKLGRMFPDKKADMPDSVKLVSQILHFVASSARRDAERIISNFEGTAPEIPVVAVNMVRNLHASIHDSAMPTETARLQQDKMLQMISDKLVAAEEKHFGG